MKKMKKCAWAIMPAIVLVWSLQSCEPQPDSLKLLDQFVVSTNYDTEADFGSYTTFAIPHDTIGLVSNLPSDDTIVVGSSYARPVVNQVISNLITRGYSEVDKDEDPDVAVNVYVLKNLNVYQSVTYPGSYPGYYYPGYYGYYGYYYYPYVNTYAYNTGTLVIEIVDLKNITAQNTVKIIWNAYMGDVFSSVDRNQQSVDAIDQAFVQSPFLQKQ